MAYNSFPYSDYHELNLDYLLNKAKAIEGNVADSARSAELAGQKAALAYQQASSSANSAQASANSAAASAQSAQASETSATQARAAAGDPKTFTAATQLTDTEKIYVYVGGTTATYTYGHFYYYSGGVWHDGGVYGTWTTDSTLSPTSTNAVQNKVLKGNFDTLDSAVDLIVKGTTTYDTYVQGYRTQADYYNVHSQSTRCTSADVYHVYAGDTVTISNIASGTKCAILATPPNYDSGWKTADFTYTAAADQIIFVECAASDDTADILPTAITTVLTIVDRASRVTENAEEISSLKSDLGVTISQVYDGINRSYFVPSPIQSGYISKTGSVGDNSANARLSFFMSKAACMGVTIPKDCKIRFAYYSGTTNADFISSDDVFTPCGAGIVNVPKMPANATHFRFTLVKNDVSAFTSAELTQYGEAIVFYNGEFKDTERAELADYLKKTYIKNVPYSQANPNFPITTGYVANDGSILQSSKYRRTDFFLWTEKRFCITVDSSYVPRVAFYDGTSGAVFISLKVFRYSADLYYVEAPTNTGRLVVDFHATDFHDMTSADETTLADTFKIYAALNNPYYSFTDNQCKARFVEFMNEYAQKIGMTGTTFTNASGLQRTNVITAQDELKLCLAVAGNNKGMDLWSIKDRSFAIGGDHARTINVVSNVYGVEPAGSPYKLLGGKGGSLVGGENVPFVKCRICLYNVNNVPVALAITSKGEAAYNNMPSIATDILGMMSAKMNGETPTESSNVTALISAGGGYCAIPVMNIPGAYLNSYNSADIVARSEGISNNATASQTPASTTKTMTMLCALAIAADLTEVLTVKPGDISSGSGTAFYSGDKVTLEDAIKIMMMESSNTMAEMVGRIIGNKLLTMEAKRSAV